MENVISMIRKDIKYWWLFLVVGIFLISTGIYTILSPLYSYLALAVTFGVSVGIIGVSRIVFAIANHQILPAWGWTLAVGILDVLVSFILMTYTGFTMVLLPFLLGFWVLTNGIALISYSTELQLMKEPGWGWITTGGIVTILIAIFVMYNPIIGFITVIGWTAIAFITAGIFFVALSWRLKRIKKGLAL